MPVAFKQKVLQVGPVKLGGSLLGVFFFGFGVVFYKVFREGQPLRMIFCCFDY